MKTVFAIHAPDTDKLNSVISDMRDLGAPTIRVVNCGDHYIALEGSHRLAAAAELYLEPAFVVFEQDDVIDIEEFDWAADATWIEAGREYTAGEVAGELFGVDAISYSFD